MNTQDNKKTVQHAQLHGYRQSSVDSKKMINDKGDYWKLSETGKSWSTKGQTLPYNSLGDLKKSRKW